MVCSAAGGDRGSGANLGQLLRRYGVACNADALISCVQQVMRCTQVC